MENQIDIVLKAIDEATGVIKSVQSEIQILSKKAQESATKIGNANKTAATSFTSLAKGISIAAAAYGAFAAGKELFKLTGYVEQAKIGFTTLLKSEDAALKMMKDIDVFASKTPFEKTDLTPLVQQLLGMGFASDHALATMQVLGDSMAALGRGREDLQGVIVAMGQIQTKGHLVQQELNQMAERGLPVFQILWEKLHLTKDQLGDIGKEGISSATAINALLTGLNERFNGAMQRQNKTLLWQWSNIMDNIKSIIGNAGQDINKTVTGWLSTINDFVDKNRANIGKLVQNILVDITNMAVSAWMVFKDLFSIVSNTLAEATSDTQKSAWSQMNSWSQLFLYVSGGWIGLMWTIRAVLAGFVGMVKIASHLIISTLIGVAWLVATAVGAFLMPIQILINTVIDGVNKFSDVLGIKTIQKMTIATTAITQGVNAMRYAVTDGAAFIGDAWTEMGMWVAAAWHDSTEQIKANVAQTKAEIKKDGNTSNVFGDIQKTLQDMKKSLEDVKKWHGSAKDAAKEHAEELKKLKANAEDAVKDVIGKLKDEKKEIDDTKDKIKKLAEEWGKYKQEGVKALSEVNNELQKLKKEAADITTKSNSDRDTKMAERLVEVYKEIEDKKKDIASAQGDGDMQKVVDLQNEMVKLEQERDYIKSSVNEKTINEAQAYADMSKAQQIAYDADKQRQKDLQENTDKQNSLIEKRMILEAQANQKSISDMGILIGMKDGMLTASMLNEKGQRVEIHDAENIALANEIATKQAQYKADADALTKTLQEKLNAQAWHIAQVTQLYSEFNKYLKKDTAQTAQAMITELNGVTKMLLSVIALRQQAWFGSVQAVVPVSGTRADGGPVERGSTYLVGERGPELFVPNSSGSIVPNESMGQTVNININLWGVQVKSEADMNTLVKKIKEEIARDVQTYKLWIV